MSLFDVSFFKRLGFYLIGLSLGLVFLAFFFKEKRTEFCYLPNCRVLKNMRLKPMTYSEEISKRIAMKEIDTTYLKQFLIDGNVLFSESDTNKEPCKFFVVEKTIEEQKLTLEIENCSDKIFISKLNRL